MAAAIELRKDYDGLGLRALAKKTKDAAQGDPWTHVRVLLDRKSVV